MPLGSRIIDAIVEKHTRDTNALNMAIPGVEILSDEDMLEIELSDKPFPM